MRETLLVQMTKHCCQFPCLSQLTSHSLTSDDVARRFLRARKFNLKLSKEMLRECQHWRGTIEGVGIDELYRRIDPFDVCLASHFSRFTLTDV